MRLIAAFAAAFCALWAASAPAYGDNRIAVQPDGKILVAGGEGFGFGVLARLESDGDLDPTFGEGGVLFDRTSSTFTDVVLQPDGKILVLNSWAQPRRFEADGSPDLGFGEGGTAVRAPVALLERPAIALLPDGRIGLGGNLHVKMSTHRALAFVFSPDGRSVEQVGEIGPAQTYFVPGEGNLAGSLSALAPWRDGTLLMAGSAYPSFQSSEGGRTVLARLEPGAGSDYDPDFGGAGLVTVPFPGALPFLAALEPVAGGAYAAGGALDRIVLARFSEEGALDGGFGSGGYAEVPPLPGFSQGNGLAVQADGRVVVAGEEVSKEGRTGRSCRGCRSPLLARYLPNGALDASFGNAGVAGVTAADGSPARAMGETVVALPDGGLLVGGTATSRKPRVLVSRVRPDGQVDRSFGDGGIATVDACPGSLTAQRRAGCLPSARVSLRVRRGSRGRIALHLRARPNVNWADLTGLHLTLPRQLGVVKDRGREIETTVVESDGPRPARVGLAGSRLGGYWSTGLRSISVAVPASVLRRVEKAPAGAKLPFRVEVQLGSSIGYAGTVQRIVLRRVLG